MSARKAPKALTTSDVARPRVLAMTAVGAVVGVGVAVAGLRTPLTEDRPLPKPHAKLTCASCHDGASEPRARPHDGGACTSCHGAGHGSTRSAHRSLAAKGELSCASCHRQHAGAQGVTFLDADVVRWAAGAEEHLPSSAKASGPTASPSAVTVPLVALAACASCHDATSPRDPIAACVPASVRSGGADLRRTPSLCFDEHRTLETAVASSKTDAARPCASQHGPSRFVAWDAARAVAQTTAWVEPARRQGSPWAPLFGAAVGALVVGGSAAAASRRRTGAATREASKPRLSAERRRLPVIDPTTCLGCYACVDVCPFDVLAIERYVAVVARPEECCGVVTCEQVCPNGSLKVASGEIVEDRPVTDEHLESRDEPGLYVAGDLTGLPLIKNAIHQGVRAIDHVASTLPRARGELLDVLVVGAGPAGLAAALRAKEKGLSAVVLEQATVAASIKSFPRDKIVHDPPLDLPVEGELWLREATKEELLAQWTRIVRARELDVREGHRVVDITRADDGFAVTIERADGRATLRSRRVVVATGRRGTPRRLDLRVEPGAEEKIAYSLADARSFAGKRVVVAGLGDSAMEAAIALARQPGTSVTVSYRGARFQRGKARNIAEIESLVAQRKIRLLFETVPVEITRTSVVLARSESAKERQAVAADALLVLVGGIPSWDLLTRAGIRRSGAGERKATETHSLEPSAP